jgi:hypothetical protein
LRIDPRKNYARYGLATSLKARSPVYGVVLAVLLRLNRLRGWAMWGGVILLFGVLRFGDSFVRNHADWIVPFESAKALLWAALILVIIANPVFDILLRFDREGQHALSPDERRATNWYFPCLALGAACALWTWIGHGASLPRGMGMAAFFLCSAVTQAFEPASAYARRRMIVFTAIAGACLLLAPVVGFIGIFLLATKRGAVGLSLVLFSLWLPVLVMLFAAFSEEIRNWLERHRPDND